MKKINIFRISLLAPILLSIIFLIIYFVAGRIGVVSTTAFVNFPEGNLVFDHQLPFVISRLWDVPISYFYLLLVLLVARDEERGKKFVLSVAVLLFSMFFAFGLHFILGLAFALFAFFFGGAMAGSIKGGMIVSAVVCLATVFFLGLVTGFGPGLTVGITIASTLIILVSITVIILYCTWMILNKIFKYLHRWMFAAS